MEALFITTLCAAAAAIASPPDDSLADAVALRFTFDADQVESISVDHSELAPKPPFGQARSGRLNIAAGGGLDLRDSEHRLYQVGIGYSYFIIDDLSLEPQLNVLYFDQDGNDAVGGNVNLLFRWHMYTAESWSFYLDAGAGVLGLTERVPGDGTRFNFTPQAGVGFTFDIGADVRLMTGVKWHHVSNANLFDDNPGRDSVMGYVGLSFPF